MINHTYNLPALLFVGGESKTFIFKLYDRYGYEFDAAGSDVGFAIINYANKNGMPIITKKATISEGLNGVMNIASVELTPEDTLYLHGRYIYQLSIVDRYNDAEIPGQGIIDIARNIHPEFISN